MVEAGRSDLQGQPHLHSELEASLDHITPCRFSCYYCYCVVLFKKEIMVKLETLLISPRGNSIGMNSVARNKQILAGQWWLRLLVVNSCREEGKLKKDQNKHGFQI